MTCRQANDPRRRYYTLLSVGKRDLRWDEDTYRAFLRDHGASEIDGRISAKTMAIGDLVQAVEDMKHLGFHPRKRYTDDWRNPRIDKAYAIWCTLYDAGVVRDKRFVTFERWCMTLTKVAKLEWANSPQLNNCVEGLKKWAQRERVELPQ